MLNFGWQQFGLSAKRLIRASTITIHTETKKLSSYTTMYGWLMLAKRWRVVCVSVCVCRAEKLVDFINFRFTSGFNFISIFLSTSFACTPFSFSFSLTFDSASAGISNIVKLFTSETNEITIFAWYACAFWSHSELHDCSTFNAIQSMPVTHETIVKFCDNDIIIIEHRIEMIGQSIWLAVIWNGTKSFCLLPWKSFHSEINSLQLNYLTNGRTHWNGFCRARTLPIHTRGV